MTLFEKKNISPMLIGVQGAPFDDPMTSLVLGQYREGKSEYEGHVTLGVSEKVVEQLKALECDTIPFDKLPAGNENAVWVKPELVCVVEYMADTKESRRQAVFKGIRVE